MHSQLCPPTTLKSENIAGILGDNKVTIFYDLSPVTHLLVYAYPVKEKFNIVKFSPRFQKGCQLDRLTDKFQLFGPNRLCLGFLIEPFSFPYDIIPVDLVLLQLAIGQIIKE